VDQFDNPDHGMQTFHGIRVVQNTYSPAKSVADPVVSPSGGPTFPASDDVEIAATPT
jgi:hypothetical protein